uniref:Pyrimidodiazepine synthase n=1 Tax=Schistocephalus solidus TaxID=70667 RepID=A0A0X3NWV2_SCHSO
MSSDEVQHLKEGDPEPTVNPDKFTLYDMHFCPFCQRVRYTLDYHQIPYDRILISPDSKPSWYLQRNSSGRVPLLLYKNEKHIQSNDIMKFVDEFKGTEASLLNVCGEEGFKKALDLASSIAHSRYKLCYTPDATKADADALKASLSNIDKAIMGPYLMGEELSLADLALFPFLNAWDIMMSRVLKVDSASGDSVETVASQWPNVVKYHQLMSQKPYIMKTAFHDNAFAEFLDTQMAKRPAVKS